MEAVGNLLGPLMVLAVLFILYMLPWLIALERKHPNSAPIFVVNLFLGWTLIGFVVCLAWAVGNKVPQSDYMKPGEC